ncbi:MAG TPA: sigma 54-interacting transcriptional regulator [Pseudomonadales bacterium]|nr:sigma 54-interacting transcriptional regulator [Pseudomonadales bacterium]
MSENEPAPSIATLGELRASGYEVQPIREEMRRNLMRKLADGEDLFPGIVGYEDTVIPQVENAILAGQDIILLGERGQAKTRLIRAFTSLLDAWTPILAGLEIPEDPFAPISPQGRALVAAEGDAAPVVWLSRAERYGEKLATPDITIADLIGEVDPIKIAEGRYLSDELTLSYGLVPRTNRGIFAINELPDLSERIQVGLLNVMQERDVQIRGHKVRLPLDVMIVATANPEDYTNRGRIITPLKDRYGAQIRTHYPRTLEQEIRVMDLEHARLDMGEYRTSVPHFMKEILADITRLARQSPDISQRSGVSVRVSVSNYETVLANALRRAIRTSEQDVVPRVSDLQFLIPSMQGKIEFEAFEEGREDQILMHLVEQAVRDVFKRKVNIETLDPVVEAFEQGVVAEIGESMPASAYSRLLLEVDGLNDAVGRLCPEGNGAVRASACEFILEGLHLNKLLNKDRITGGATYRSP